MYGKNMDVTLVLLIWFWVICNVITFCTVTYDKLRVLRTSSSGSSSSSTAAAGGATSSGSTGASNTTSTTQTSSSISSTASSTSSSSLSSSSSSSSSQSMPFPLQQTYDILKKFTNSRIFTSLFGADFGNNTRRVSDKALLFLALIGGGYGGLAAMHFFHHKTSPRFRSKFLTFMAINLAALVLMFTSLYVPA